MITNEEIIEQIKKGVNKKPLFYVTRYKERGSGLGCSLKNFKTITTTPPKDTAEILEKKSFPLKSNIIVFKNNARIQRICKEKKLNLLNPDYHLVEKYENKISQYKWLKTIIPASLPKTVITTPNKNSFQKIGQILGKPFIGQFNRSHTGQGTLLISKTKQWKELVEKFPQRKIKCTQFINGPVITVNICLWPALSADEQGCILMGNPSYQITGLKQLTDFPYSTTGNDWSLAQKILNSNDFKTIKTLCQKIGKAMIKNGWQGLFGLDFIKGKKWLVIEINARQPASTGLETALQKKQGKGITIFAAHVAALLQLPLPTCPAGRPGTCDEIEKSFQKINQGAQIIIRKKRRSKYTKFHPVKCRKAAISPRASAKLFNRVEKTLCNPLKQSVSKGKKKGPDPIRIIKGEVETEKHNAELFRIQNFKSGFVTKNNQLNTFAKQLLKNFK
ncbi:hypothetical protein KKG58_02930 [Patescibacteria group bacterium]|nr:hypothetical protein [Patescibacteria group bacterium]